MIRSGRLVGFYEYVARPRLTTVVTGKRPDGSAYDDPVVANLEFFDLTYEAPLRVASNREFGRIAPLLWMRAGSRGRRIDDMTDGWDVANAYGVIVDFDDVGAFLNAMMKSPDATHAFVVTDDDWLFQVGVSPPARARRAGAALRGVPAQLPV